MVNFTNDDFIPIAVKLGAVIGAVQIVQGAINESDNERKAHGGIGGPLLGFIRGAGAVVLGSFQQVGRIAARLLPPGDPKIDGPHIVDAIVVATGPAALGVLFAAIYTDAKRRGEFGLSRY
eukprot:jgi/Mesen1/5095/ME000252S04201